MTDPLLAGRRIVVTGAASGIGRATAELFAAAGARVALLDRDGRVGGVAAGIAGAIGIVADVADEAGVAAAIDRAAAAFGGLDGVVNAAGTDLVRAVTQMSLDDWNRVFAVNVTGAFLVCRAALPALQATPGATIVNVASGAGLRPLPLRSAYCASKAALVMFGKALAMEAPAVRVNTICPGIVDTPMFRASYEAAADPEAELAAILDRYVIRRVGEPREIAEVALFLTGPGSSMMTGAAIAVDGGRTFH